MVIMINEKNFLLEYEFFVKSFDTTNLSRLIQLICCVS